MCPYHWLSATPTRHHGSSWGCHCYMISVEWLLPGTGHAPGVPGIWQAEQHHYGICFPGNQSNSTFLRHLWLTLCAFVSSFNIYCGWPIVLETLCLMLSWSPTLCALTEWIPVRWHWVLKSTWPKVHQPSASCQSSLLEDLRCISKTFLLGAVCCCHHYNFPNNRVFFLIYIVDGTAVLLSPTICRLLQYCSEGLHAHPS